MFNISFQNLTTVTKQQEINKMVEDIHTYTFNISRVGLPTQLTAGIHYNYNSVPYNKKNKRCASATGSRYN